MWKNIDSWLQVMVEYVERERWPSDEVLTKRQTSEPRSQASSESRHMTHLQCYRSRHSSSKTDPGACCNGHITRSVESRDSKGISELPYKTAVLEIIRR